MDKLAQYYNYWLKTANNVTRNPQIACDLVHFAIAAAAGRPRFETIRNSEQIKPYINTIIVFEWHNRLSAYHKASKCIASQELKESIVVTDEVDSSARIANETADIDITRLPEFERDLVLLYFEENKSVRELSEDIGIPYEYTKYVVTNAIKKLKNHNDVRKRRNAAREI